jgi:hypothetical protein
MNKPNVYTYSPDDRKVRNELPRIIFAKARKQRTPTPDRRKALNIDIRPIKKRVKVA